MPETAENRVQRAREAANNPTLPDELLAFLREHQTSKDLVAEFERIKEEMLTLVVDEHPCDDCDTLIDGWYDPIVAMVKREVKTVLEASNATTKEASHIYAELELLDGTDKEKEGKDLLTILNQLRATFQALGSWSGEFVCRSLSHDPPA